MWLVGLACHRQWAMNEKLTRMLAPARRKHGLVRAEDDAGQLDALGPGAHLGGGQHLLEVLAVAPLRLAQAPVATGEGFKTLDSNLEKNV